MADPGAAPTATLTIRRYLTFRVARRLYALRAEDIAEVIPVPAVARVPHSPPALLGIANLRGAVLPLVGLRELLGKPQDQAGAMSANAIVLDGGAPVAVNVDLVETLVSIDASKIETREAELGAEPGEVLSGAFKIGASGEVAKILDLKGLLGAAFVQRTRPQRQARAIDAAAAVQQSSPEAAGKSEMLVTFEVAGQEYALSLDAVKEILPAPDAFTSLPRTEAVVLGVVSLRDRLLPLLSLRGLLGFPTAQAASTREKVLVMKLGRGQVGLVADQARAVIAAQSSSIDPIPEVLAARTGGEARIKAIYRGQSGRRLISILSPEQLFREDVMQRLGSGTEVESAAPLKAAQGELRFLVFRLGQDEFALPIDAVDEVGQVPAQITRLPKTPKFLEGVINLRGEVLPVVDQRRRFDMPERSASERPRLVVVRSERHRAGIIVDSVSDVLRVASGAVEPAPDLTDEIARLVRGVINLEKSQRMVLVLDPTELLTAAERRLLDAFQKARQAGA